LKHVQCTGTTDQNGVEAFSGDVLKTQPAGGIGLGIKVDQENSTTRLGCPCGQMNGGGGLSHAPFLIHNGNYAHTQGKRGQLSMSRGFPEWFT
jgi:hypothetical protein